MLVSDLKKEIVQLRDTVHQLQAKVEFLLSFVGIELTVASSSITSTSLAAAPQLGSDANVDTSLTSTAHQSVEYEKTGNQLSDNDFPVLGHPPVTSQSAMNYVGAARQTSNLCTVQNNFRDAVVAAVYVDQRRSEQRANSFITALHAMQTRSSDENSVRLSVCLSVRPSVTRVYCDKTVERSAQIYIPYER